MKARMLDSNIDNIKQNTGGYLNQKSKIRHSSTEVFTLFNFLNPFIESLLVLKSPNQKENWSSFESNQTDLKFFVEEEKNKFLSKLKIDDEIEGQIIHSFHIMNQIWQMEQVSATANEFSEKTNSIYQTKVDKSIDFANGNSRETNREQSKVGLVENNQGEKVLQISRKVGNSENNDSKGIKFENRNTIFIAKEKSSRSSENNIIFYNTALLGKSYRAPERLEPSGTNNQNLTNNKILHSEANSKGSYNFGYENENIKLNKTENTFGEAGNFNHKVNREVKRVLVDTAANEFRVETDTIYETKADKSIDIANGNSRDTNRELSEVGLVENNQGEKVRQSKYSSVNSNNLILNELVSRSYVPYQKINIKGTDKFFPILNNNLSSYDKHTQSLLTARMILNQSDSDTTTFFCPKASKNVFNAFYLNGFNPIIPNTTDKLDVSELMPKRNKGSEMVRNLPNSVRQNSSVQLISILKTIDLMEKQNVLNQQNILNNQGLQNFENTNQDSEKFKINNLSNEEYKFEQRDKSEQKPVEKSTNYNGNFSKATDFEQNKVLPLHQSNRQVINENDPSKEIVKPRENIIHCKFSELPSKISSIVNSATQFPARAEILLNPKTLGIVIVDITVVNNEVKVMFKTETKEAQRMIEGQIGLLKEKLTSLGFEKQTFDFVYQSEDKPFSGFGSNCNESRTEEELLRRQFVRSFTIFNLKNENNFESIWRENDLRYQSSESK